MDERFQVAASAIIGMIAGAIGILSEIEKGRIVRFVHVLRTVLLSAFLGALTGFACQGIGVDMRLAFAIAGLVAFGGDRILTVLLTFGKLKVGPVEIEVEKEKKGGDGNKPKPHEPEASP